MSLRDNPTNLTTLEFARLLECTFTTPTPILRDAIRRLQEAAEHEEESAKLAVGIHYRNCPACGTKLTVDAKGQVEATPV